MSNGRDRIQALKKHLAGCIEQLDMVAELLCDNPEYEYEASTCEAQASRARDALLSDREGK